MLTTSKMIKRLTLLIGVASVAACTPNIGGLGSAGSSNLLATQVPTDGILDALQASSGSVSDYINSFALQIDKTCNGVAQDKLITEPYDFSNQNVSFSLDPDCNYSILMVLGTKNGNAVQPIFAYNKNAEPLIVTAEQLKTHVANNPNQSYPMNIVLGLTTEATGKISERAAGAIEQQQAEAIPVPTPSVTQAQPAPQCKFLFATGKEADGRTWCSACTAFSPDWHTAQSQLSSAAEFIEISYGYSEGFISNQENATEKQSLMAGLDPNSFPSVYGVNRDGQATKIGASVGSIQQFSSTNCQ